MFPGNNENLSALIEGLKKESNNDSMANVSFAPSIEISEDVYKKIMYWIEKSDFEISGLGKIMVDKESNTIRVIDACLIKQENSAASTDLDAAAVGKAMFLLKDAPGDLRFWWHSHVNMGVFWSGTDQATIKQISTHGWFVSTVFNKKREMKSAFSQSGPIRLIIEDVPTKIEQIIDPNLVAQWDKEYNDNVTIKNYQTIIGNFDGGEYPTGQQLSLADMFDQSNDDAPAVEADDDSPTVDYSQEMEKRLDVVWKAFENGEITEDQLNTMHKEIEDEYEVYEENEDVEQENNPINKLDLDEEEKDDLIRYIDHDGNIRLRVRN